ncbi:MAG: hypothetical protein P1P81_05795, partial [Desulfobulbales bacterium]|nr:hypothetical protein [Desulfobulbales bacterium]
MSPSNSKPPLRDQRGFGLVAALFVVVILAMFGVLTARYIFTTSVSSAEDYLWSQALYAAEAAAHKRILYHDGGGAGGFVAPVVQNITTTVVSDTFVAAGNPAALAFRGRFSGTG